MDPHGEKPSGDGYHANGQSDSEVWSEPVTEPAEARRPRLSFTDTYVEIQCVPHTRICTCFMSALLTLSHHQININTLVVVEIHWDVCSAASFIDVFIVIIAIHQNLQTVRNSLDSCASNSPVSYGIGFVPK